MSIRRNHGPAALREWAPLAPLSTLQIGANCRALIEVRTQEELWEAWHWSRHQQLKTLFLGEGSNVLFPDKDFPGLVIRNRIRGLWRQNSVVKVAGGENLCRFIECLNRWGLAGLEKLYGIPGSVAGALVGNAGAYGQEIGDRVSEIEVWSPEGPLKLTPQQAGFRYRHSLFKEKRQWFVLGCRVELVPGKEELQAVSDAILRKRLVKYPTGLKCPGSFFKNVVLSESGITAIERIPEDFIQFGKVPAGKLLEAVGAKGARRGRAQFADYHANLVVNLGGATCRDILDLTEEYSERVFKRFCVRLEPEILIVTAESGC